MNNPINGMLGIAYRGKKVSIGDDALLKMRDAKVNLLLLAADASANTKKRYNDKAHFYHVAVIEYADKELLGKIFGKTLISAVGICDKNIASKITSLIKDGDCNGL